MKKKKEIKKPVVCNRCGKYISNFDKKTFETHGICRKCLQNIKLDS